jgi:hypothetical protein
MGAIGNGCNQRFKEGGSNSHVGAFDQLNEGELRGAVDGHEEIEFAFSSANAAVRTSAKSIWK